MSKTLKTKPDSAPAGAQNPPTQSLDQAAVAPDGIPQYRRCPLCWGGRRGVGIATSTRDFTRYYKCQRSSDPALADYGGCGHTWTATISPAEILRAEHRPVELDER